MSAPDRGERPSPQPAVVAYLRNRTCEVSIPLRHEVGKGHRPLEGHDQLLRGLPVWSFLPPWVGLLVALLVLGGPQHCLLPR